MRTSPPPATTAAPGRERSLIRFLGAWGAALAVWLVGFSLVARLAPRGLSGDSFSDFDRLVRFDLPWVAISALMVAVAGVVHRDRTRRVRWYAAVLAVPLAVTAAGTAAPIAWDGEVLATVLYVVEGVAGTAAGLAVAVAAGTGAGPERHGGYW